MTRAGTSHGRHWKRSLWVVAVLAAQGALAAAEEPGGEGVPEPAGSGGGRPGWEFVGGGGVNGGVSWHDMGPAAHLGWVIGGGGYAYVYRRSLRVGGGGGTASFGEEPTWHYSMSYGGLSAEWVFRFRDWLQLPLGVYLGFGTARLDEATGAEPPPGSPSGTVVLRRRRGFVALLQPTAALEFIPLRFLKLSVNAWFTYTHWVVNPGWSIGAGAALHFGAFRPH